MTPNLGAAAEYRFASELLARGIIPTWPSTEDRPYDMIADVGTAMYKIQVKSTSKEGEAVDAQFMQQHGPRKRRYQKNEIDFIVLYVSKRDLWYIFPIDDIETSVRVKPESTTCKYRIYKEAWHLLASDPIIR